MDLPGQLQVARENVKQAGLTDRIHFFPANLLDEKIPFPKGFDAIWMSQFLDCFSETEIVSILKRCYDSVTEDEYVMILEAFWDTPTVRNSGILFTADFHLFHCISEWKQSDVSFQSIYPLYRKGRLFREGKNR